MYIIYSKLFVKFIRKNTLIMMKFSTKFSAILSICALMTICSVTPASATSQSYSNEDHGFVNDWEMVQGVGTWVIKYGYNNLLD